jgi:HK97 family phage prohead protease
MSHKTPPTDDAIATKALGALEIKSEEKGEVEAVIATLNVVDKDGDIIRPGAIADGSKVSMSSYGHDAMYGGAPVGKGTLSVDGNRVIFKGRMFLATDRGRETFETLKEMGADQQWSFGFRIRGYEVPSDEDRKQGARMILTKLEAFEVSPVIVGAGRGTRTLAMKSAEDPEPETSDVGKKKDDPPPPPVERDVALEMRIARVKRTIGR